MLINEISERCNVSIDTLRYYDRIGLLKPKRKNNIRQYLEEDVLTLNHIILMKNLLFSLEDIKKIFDLDYQIDNKLKENKLDINACEHMLEDIKNKWDELTQKEEEIRTVKLKLKHFMDKIKQIMGDEN